MSNEDQKCQIQFLEKGRRVLDNRIYDIIDYKFTVSAGDKTSTVAVCISGVFHDPLMAIQGRCLTAKELASVAEHWLKSRIAKGYDPFSEPAQYERIMQVPSIVMEYFVSNQALPGWI